MQNLLYVLITIALVSLAVASNKRIKLSLVSIVVLAFGGLAANLVMGNTPALGLDLQGGVSVVLQPKQAASSDALDVAVGIIRQRVDSLGVAEPEISRQGGNIVVNLPGVKNKDEALALVGKPGFVELRPVLATGAKPTGSTTTTVAPGGSTTTIAGATSTSEKSTTTSAAVGGPGSGRRYGAASTTTTSTTPAAPSNGSDILEGLSNDPEIYQVGPAGARGDVFSNDAKADVVNGSWAVIVSLRDGAAGLDQWNAMATECYNRAATCPTQRLAIVLDGIVQSAPTVQEPTFNGGNVQISGSFKEGEAKSLARILQFGSINVQFNPATVQTISATLGKDSLHAAVVSGLVGVLLVLLFLAFYYRLMTLVVVAGLAVSASLLWSIIGVISKTNGLALTLSGAAGIIVSVGVTVDSYVVFFEKLRDDVRAGRTLRNSAQRGFTSAWRTILAADTVSLLGAAILWWLTSGSVRGFAFFLGLSTLCDMVVAYYFTRPAVLLLARTQRMNRGRIMGVRSATGESAS